jgi:N-acetylglutamate synthase-like GNAT family acetyltransferase
MSTQQSATQIRVASAADAEKITVLINRAFKIAEQFFIDEDRIDLKTVLEYLAKGEFLVGDNNEMMWGCVYLEQQGDRTYLGLLSIDPDLQQSGLGSRLMSAAEDYCRARNSTYIDILTVSLREELRGYYGKRGFVVTGTTPFPDDVQTKVPCHFVNMSKRL